ncbi:MAG: Stp1/IreP family PP2C-type Ser/Thr phosphatase [Gemmatimonadales bacterium]
MSLSVRFVCAGKTDVGIVRSGNEDNYLMVPDRGVFVVADGMGGHAAGEVASEMAVRIITQSVGDPTGLPEAEAAERMRTAIREANGAIFQRTLTEHDKRGMGTTATALAFLDGGRYLLGQVGDSRAYLLRDGSLHQLTKDHSYVQEQVDAGYLSSEEARTHPYSNVITRGVGSNNDVAPDTYSGAARAGDLLLLASDGLTGMMDDPDLHAILMTSRDPGELADALIAEANRRGGLDNITVVLVRVESVEHATRDERTTIAATQA